MENMMNNDELKLDAVYETLQNLSKNQVLEFLLKMESFNIETITDRMVAMRYVQMCVNNINICNKMNLGDDIKQSVLKIKHKLIAHMNMLHDINLNLN